MNPLYSLQHSLRKKNLKCALFINRDERFHPMMAYLLSSPVPPQGFLVVPARGSPVLLLSSLEEAPPGIRVQRYGSRKKLFSLLKKHVRGKKIGMDLAFCSAQTYHTLRRLLKKPLMDISHLVQQARTKKTQKELRILARACAISDEILASCIARFSDFTTEKEVGQFLITETIKHGCTLAFPPIVASGAHCAAPHARPKNTLLNGFCVIDFGVRFQGYCTDTTRTVYLGNPSPREKQAYHLVRKTQETLVSEAVPGASCAAIAAKANTLLGQYARFFIHGLGHGVGLEVHELPVLAPGSKERLEKNMVVTIEPGIYIPKKFGIRIEDTLVIGTRPRVLTTLSKELICIPKKIKKEK